MDALAPAVLCGNLVATCTQDRRLWIWIYPWISTEKSVDVGMDMDEKFNFISTASLAIDSAVGEWRQRLHACVRAGGGHFEHRLK